MNEHLVRSDQVSALYVDPSGPYPGLVVDYWDVKRDATTYGGPRPVVVHPPCGPWGKLAFLCTKQNPDLALHAVDMVRRFGGVLEHPAGSALWRACNLPHPYRELPMLVGREWSLQVNQCDWGHKAEKKTWLFFKDVCPSGLPPLPSPGHPTHVIDDNSAAPARDRGLKHLSKKERHLTPPAFASWLVKAVSNARRRTDHPGQLADIDDGSGSSFG